jgi:hypothetical protein
MHQLSYDVTIAIDNTDSLQYYKKQTTLLSRFITKTLAFLIMEYTKPCIDNLQAIASFPCLVNLTNFGDHMIFHASDGLDIWHAGVTADIPFPGRVNCIAAGNTLITFIHLTIIVWDFDGFRAAAKHLRILNNGGIVVAGIMEMGELSPKKLLDLTQAAPPWLEDASCSIRRLTPLLSDPTLVFVETTRYIGLWDSKTLTMIHWWPFWYADIVSYSSILELPAECVCDGCEAGDMAILYRSRNITYGDNPPVVLNLRTGLRIKHPKIFDEGYTVLTALAKPRGLLLKAGQRGPLIWDQARQKILAVPRRIAGMCSRKGESPYHYVPRKNGQLVLEAATARQSGKRPGKKIDQSAAWFRRLAPVVHPATTSFSRTIDGEFIAATARGYCVIDAITGCDRLMIHHACSRDLVCNRSLAVRKFVAQEYGNTIVYGL